jgi:hypothetical protein
MVYYCSQNIDQGAGAFCGYSQDGGFSFAVPSTLVYGPASGCGAIHGHLRVSPDGTVYLPQNACAPNNAGGTGQGMAVSRDNGVTYTYSVVGDSTSSSGSDPSVVAGADNTVYYAYVDAQGHQKVATSRDHGDHWNPSADVGSPFGIKNSKFPEIMAGDGNRAAVAFLGTTTTGAVDDVNFKGVWYMYVSYTYDGGKSWTTVNATPGDPVQRGCIASAGSCRNMLDFNEITVDKAGRVLVAYTDGCTADCETNPKIDQSGCPGTQGEGTSENSPIDSTPTCTYGRHTAIVRQTCGLGLFAQYDGAIGANCYPVYPHGAPAQPAVAGQQGAGEVVTGAGTGMPNTSRATITPHPWELGISALLGVAALGLTAVRRRRRSR